MSIHTDFNEAFHNELTITSLRTTDEKMVRRYFALVNRDTPFISVVKINVDKTATVVSALIKKHSALVLC